ncbi:hypothetical protein FGO68_gene15394 [Halteria grandinella]|uniref:Uncharacterized protein n=1 Tax=Halteria grandinella TaxID=5974 RepID=A0A8J8NCG7_HALGN|nr:hypothetical protein FGO68_gene15394 [Halteria grandinella]
MNAEEKQRILISELAKVQQELLEKRQWPASSEPSNPIIDVKSATIDSIFPKNQAKPKSTPNAVFMTTGSLAKKETAPVQQPSGVKTPSNVEESKSQPGESVKKSAKPNGISKKKPADQSESKEQDGKVKAMKQAKPKKAGANDAKNFLPQVEPPKKLNKNYDMVPFEEEDIESE